MRFNLGKLLFPRLQRDQRRRALGKILLVGLAALLVAGAVAAMMVSFNKR